MKKEKNIIETLVRGKSKFCVNVTTPQKKRIKRYFDTKTEARQWLANWQKSVGIDTSDFAALAPGQIADIRIALKNLPNGYTLSRCVELVREKYITTRKLSDCMDDFLSLKENANLTPSYYAQLKSRLQKLESLTSFENCSADNVLALINNLGISPKTQLHYFTTFKEFFDWCTTRGYTKDSPFAHIHDADKPKIPLSNPQVPTVEMTKKFFANAEAKYPHWAGICALVAFGGFRREEARKIELSDIDFEERRIILQMQKSKTRQNWLQEDMPENVWAWLEKYPPNEKWAKFNNNAFEYMNYAKYIPRNGLRHAFATYHLSLLRNAPKTSILMRHRSPNMLWQHYLAGLVSKDVADKYFAIVPENVS